MSDYERYSNEPSRGGETLEERQRRLEDEYWESTADWPHNVRQELYHSFCSEQDKRTLAEIASRQKQFLAGAHSRWEADKEHYAPMTDAPDEWEDIGSVTFNWEFDEREAWIAMFGDVSGYVGWSPPVNWEETT